jgi:hypothetical protein
VEGAESLVFRGAQSALNRADAPAILFECSNLTSRGFGLSGADSIDFLQSLWAAHYTFYEIQGAGALVSLGASRPEHCNLLAVPARRGHLAEIQAADRKC